VKNLGFFTYLLSGRPGRSFVTGLGVRPPMRPHDRRSGGDHVDDPWPGYLFFSVTATPAPSIRRTDVSSFGFLVMAST
jgi:hypothetical protein